MSLLGACNSLRSQLFPLYGWDISMFGAKDERYLAIIPISGVT